MNCEYILISGTYLDENGTHKGYGIAAVSINGDVLEAAHDMSCDKWAVEELVVKCNEHELSLVHFQEVVEDFLS